MDYHENTMQRKSVHFFRLPVNFHSLLLRTLDMLCSSRSGHIIVTAAVIVSFLSSGTTRMAIIAMRVEFGQVDFVHFHMC